jgi:hypothetical protein
MKGEWMAIHGLSTSRTLTARMRDSLILTSILLLAGCVNLTTQTASTNYTAQALRESSDCVPVVLGFAYGTASVEEALSKNAPLISNYNEPPDQIAKVRSVAIHDYYFLIAGARCVEVTGE